MLSELSIENYVLIPSLKIKFGQGFNVITGETGAGKSILLGALSLILGQRADSHSLLNQSRKCVIEGVFTQLGVVVNEWLQYHELDDGDSVILRRELAPGGKSRAFINDTPVQLSQLKELGDLLVDVHSQHNTLFLNEAGFQLAVIDHFADNNSLLAGYKKAFLRYHDLLKQRETLVAEEKRKATESDFLQFQLDELMQARLKQGEQEEFEEELKTLTHAEEIKAKLSAITEGLISADQNLVGNLKVIENLLKQVTLIYPPVAQLGDRLQSCLIELSDIGDEIAAKGEKMSYNPERIAVLQERLDLIYRLEHKHRVNSVAELIAIQESLASQLNSLASLSEELAEIERQVALSKTEAHTLAVGLSDRRSNSFNSFSRAVLDNLAQVGMPHARLIVSHQVLPEMNEWGTDRIEFLFNANPGGELRQLSKIASGGELSRVMLAVKAVLANRSLVGAIIFDEIDTGVSGETASKLAAVMHQMSQGVQLIVITHLPQIAARGDCHFRVFKTINDGQTCSNIDQLDFNQRVDELAGMLGGDAVLAEARATAKQLLLSNVSLKNH
ncbi:MAG: DNA repair protein RecN [Bacteroidales bacterium]|nr:DNA repair protein RecN [Bacteroidales bacterium]MDD3664127.1 DNA repair protein RecN [Bacteroidales bacterium]